MTAWVVAQVPSTPGAEPKITRLDAGGYQRTDVWVGVWKNGKWTTVGGTKHTRELPQPTG